MKARFYVVFDQLGFVQAFKTDRFELRQGQYATQIELDVPDEAFAPLNVPKVTISLPAEALRRTFEAQVEEVPE